MITDADIKKMKKVFVTKDDLLDMERRQDKKFVTKQDLQNGLKKIGRKLDLTIKTFDKGFNYHHRRLVQLEEKVDVKPPPFIVKVN